MRQVSTMSWSRMKPRHKTLTPGSPSLLRPKKPPNSPIQRTIWAKLGCHSLTPFPPYSTPFNLWVKICLMEKGLGDEVNHSCTRNKITRPTLSPTTKCTPSGDHEAL
jgi:hypothetical protein